MLGNSSLIRTLVTFASKWGSSAYSRMLNKRATGFFRFLCFLFAFIFYTIQPFFLLLSIIFCGPFRFLLSSMSWRIWKRGILAVNRWQDHMTLFWEGGNLGEVFPQGRHTGEGIVRDDLLEDISPLSFPYDGTYSFQVSMCLWTRRFWFVAWRQSCRLVFRICFIEKFLSRTFICNICWFCLLS